jgi:putative membrane protein
LLKTPDIGGWRRTSPFAILFFIGRILRLITKNAWQSLAPLFALAVTYKGDLVSKIILAGSAFAIVVAIAAILSYWFFRFRLLDDSILIRQGVIKKTQLDIKFERIQGINTQQNIVYRYLGLVTVTFDTAGSAGSEGNLPAVTRAFAESLRSQIRGDINSEEAVAAETEPSGDALVHLDWRDMVRIGLADRRALLVFAVAGPLFERIADNAEQAIADTIAAAARYGLEIDTSNGVWIGIAVALILLIVFALVSIAAAFLRYHNFQLFLDNRTLRSHGGLLTRHEHSMDLGKIQTLRLQQGIVQRWLGRFRMTARQAMSKGGADAKKRYFDIPVVTAALADQLRPLLLGPEGGNLTQDPRSSQFAAVSPHYMRSRILFIGLVPALLATTFFSFEFGWHGLWFLSWLPVVAAIAYRSWRRAGYLHDDNEIVRLSGLL